MQAWGASSRFPRRDTLPHPTKSGILGMVAAAMGIDKFSSDQEAQLEPLRELHLSTFAVPKVVPGKNWELPISRLQDFHTVGAGYDTRDPVEKWHAPRKAGGGFSKNAVITRRDYLLDATFLVILEGSGETLGEVSRALRNPQWGIWLGRKCCLPASPLMPEIGEEREVVARVLFSKYKNLKFTKLEFFDRYLELAGPESINQLDQPVNYGTRDYQSRPVVHLLPDPQD